jgi:hypothetical protein
VGSTVFGHISLRLQNRFGQATKELRAGERSGDVHQRIWQFAQRPPCYGYANSIGCKTIALTGRDGGKLGPMAQLNIQVSVPHMGRIEDAHMIICHMIAYRFMDC